jgi:hypothetical protein
MNRGFGVFGRSAYSSILDGLVQKGLIGCSLFVTTRIVAFVLLSFLISVSVVIPASHRTFSVPLTAKALSANLIPLMWVGCNYFSTASVADPYASSPYLSVPRTIIWCTFNRLPWSAPHVFLLMKRPMSWNFQNFICMAESRGLGCIREVNRDLCKVFEWSRAYLLRLNPAKSVVLPIYRGYLLGSLLPLFLGDVFFPHVRKAKKLGIIFNYDLRLR